MAATTLETLDVLCRSCGATLTLEPHLRTAQCPYCDSPSVVERPPTPDRPDPSFVVGFVVERERATEAVRRWIGSRGPFAHSGLKRATLEKVRGVYLPAYLYGAVGESEYEAEIGENYQEVETYTTTDAKGNVQVHTRVVTRTEWRELRGRYCAYVLDVLVTASKGLPNEELETIEPFDLRALRRYTPALLSGWIAEEPSIGIDDCFRDAHDETVQRVGRDLEAFLPGDSARELRYTTRLRAEVIDLVLLPVWVFAARYDPDKPPVRVLVNGQTGEVQGKVPLSVPKIAAAVVVGLLVVVAIVLLLAASR